jgi:hypothetical protein
VKNPSEMNPSERNSYEMNPFEMNPYEMNPYLRPETILYVYRLIYMYFGKNPDGHTDGRTHGKLID